jgi:hypothetical protein
MARRLNCGVQEGFLAIFMKAICVRAVLKNRITWLPRN